PYLFVLLFCLLRYLHSFPTRRSSDLLIEEIDLSQNPNIKILDAFDSPIKKINLKNGNNNPDMSIGVALFPWGMDEPDYDPNEIRSEEHTSELQSRENLVCRLLLEKKK